MKTMEIYDDIFVNIGLDEGEAMQRGKGRRKRRKRKEKEGKGRKRKEKEGKGKEKERKVFTASQRWHIAKSIGISVGFTVGSPNKHSFHPYFFGNMMN